MEKRPYKIDVMREEIEKLKAMLAEKDEIIEGLVNEKDYYKEQYEALLEDCNQEFNLFNLF